MISDKVLAEAIGTGETYLVTKDWDVNGEQVCISIEKQ